MSNKKCRDLALDGYEKLAFGSTSDAIKLVVSENIGEFMIDKMDFFNVSEIKKTSSGAIEIKFFDRLKALEMIELLANLENDNILPFYKALEDSCKQTNKEENKFED